MHTRETDAESRDSMTDDNTSEPATNPSQSGTGTSKIRHIRFDVAAVDLVAETFAQAALSLHRFRDEKQGSALPWLYGIAGNLVRTYHERRRIERRARERLGMPARAYELDLDETDERVEAERLGPALGEALRDLPESQRRALEERVVNGLPFSEVALALGCSEVAARIRVSRALGTLSRRMKGAS